MKSHENLDEYFDKVPSLSKTLKKNFRQIKTNFRNNSWADFFNAISTLNDDAWKSTLLKQLEELTIENLQTYCANVIRFMQYLRTCSIKNSHIFVQIFTGFLDNTCQMEMIRIVKAAKSARELENLIYVLQNIPMISKMSFMYFYFSVDALQVQGIVSWLNENKSKPVESHHEKQLFYSTFSNLPASLCAKWLNVLCTIKLPELRNSLVRILGKLDSSFFEKYLEALVLLHDSCNPNQLNHIVQKLDNASSNHVCAFLQEVSKSTIHLWVLQQCDLELAIVNSLLYHINRMDLKKSKQLHRSLIKVADISDFIDIVTKLILELEKNPFQSMLLNSLVQLDKLLVYSFLNQYRQFSERQKKSLLELIGTAPPNSINWIASTLMLANFDILEKFLNALHEYSGDEKRRLTGMFLFLGPNSAVQLIDVVVLATEYIRGQVYGILLPEKCQDVPTEKSLAILRVVSTLLAKDKDSLVLLQILNVINQLSPDSKYGLLHNMLLTHLDDIDRNIELLKYVCEGTIPHEESVSLFAALAPELRFQFMGVLTRCTKDEQERLGQLLFINSHWQNVAQIQTVIKNLIELDCNSLTCLDMLLDTVSVSPSYGHIGHILVNCSNDRTIFLLKASTKMNSTSASELLSFASSLNPCEISMFHRTIDLPSSCATLNDANVGVRIRKLIDCIYDVGQGNRKIMLEILFKLRTDRSMQLVLMRVIRALEKSDIIDAFVAVLSRMEEDNIKSIVSIMNCIKSTEIRTCAVATLQRVSHSQVQSAIIILGRDYTVIKEDTIKLVSSMLTAFSGVQLDSILNVLIGIPSQFRLSLVKRLNDKLEVNWAVNALELFGCCVSAEEMEKLASILFGLPRKLQHRTTSILWPRNVSSMKITEFISICEKLESLQAINDIVDLLNQYKVYEDKRVVVEVLAKFDAIDLILHSFRLMHAADVKWSLNILHNNEIRDLNSSLSNLKRKLDQGPVLTQVEVRSNFLACLKGAQYLEVSLPTFHVVREARTLRSAEIDAKPKLSFAKPFLKTKRTVGALAPIMKPHESKYQVNTIDVANVCKAKTNTTQDATIKLENVNSAVVESDASDEQHFLLPNECYSLELTSGDSDHASYEQTSTTAISPVRRSQIKLHHKAMPRTIPSKSKTQNRIVNVSPIKTKQLKQFSMRGLYTILQDDEKCFAIRSAFENQTTTNHTISPHIGKKYISVGKTEEHADRVRNIIISQKLREPVACCRRRDCLARTTQ